MNTKTRQIHIMARDIVQRDAVGNYCLQTGNYLKSDGWDVTYWSDHFLCFDQNDNIVNSARSDFLASAQDDDILIYHFSIGDPFLPELSNFRGTKILYFHNITPPEIIDPQDELTRANCQLGYDQLGFLDMFDAVFANSNYTAKLLPQYKNLLEKKVLEVLPPVADIQKWDKVAASEVDIDPGMNNESTALIYVGRLVPNKGIEKLLYLFEQISVLGNYTLNIIGSPDESPYLTRCKELSTKMAENNDAHVSFHHDIPDEELKTLYLSAKGAVTMSLHEGFCVPALDALYFDIPFFATELPALSDVLGRAEIQLTDGDLSVMALEVHNAFQDRQFLDKHSVLRSEQRKLMNHAASSVKFISAFREMLSKL